MYAPFRNGKKTNLSSRLGDGTKVVDKIGLGHTDTRVDDGENLVLLVGDDPDAELLSGIEDGGIGKGGIADLVNGIRGVGNQFTKEDLLVAVESVY